ncbi:MAG: hypothetical protein DDT31_01390 [Syntrophomonadaceae bacterium]|nr:hypothetical protein [Bacillota bacterium]
MKEFGEGNGVLYVDKPEDTLWKAVELVHISPLRRRLSNNLASFVISVIISFLLPLATLFKRPVKYVKITDCTSGFRAIRRLIFDPIRV